MTHQRYENAARTLCGLEDGAGVQLGVGARVDCPPCLAQRASILAGIARGEARDLIRGRLRARNERRASEERLRRFRPPCTCGHLWSRHDARGCQDLRLHPPRPCPCKEKSR